MPPAKSNTLFEHMQMVRFCLAALFMGMLASLAMAESVTVEDGSGAGFLTSQGGNCYVVIPTHLHGRRMDDIRLGSDRSGGLIGSARIVYIAPGRKDISLALVRGGLAQSCGKNWRSLTRKLQATLVPGTPLMLQRPRQSVFEGRQLLMHSSGPEMIRLVPAPNERNDLFGGTSGAVAFEGTTPVAMVLIADDPTEVLAMRMDAVASLVSAYLENGDPGAFIPDPEDAHDTDVLLPRGDPVEAVSWSAHPVGGAVDPMEMLAGNGPWVFELEEQAVLLTLRLTETDRLRQIRLKARTGTEHGIPREISIITDSSRDADRPRPSHIPAPEMTSDGEFELLIGERYAHTITIGIHSKWGTGDTVRLDAVSID